MAVFVAGAINSTGANYHQTCHLWSHCFRVGINLPATHRFSWKGAKRRGHPVKTIAMRRAWLAMSRPVGTLDDESLLFEKWSGLVKSTSIGQEQSFASFILTTTAGCGSKGFVWILPFLTGSLETALQDPSMHRVHGRRGALLTSHASSFSGRADGGGRAIFVREKSRISARFVYITE